MLLALNWADTGNSYLHFSFSKQEKQLGTRRWFCLLLPTRGRMHAEDFLNYRDIHISTFIYPI